MRESHILTAAEEREFDRLPPFDGAAWKFWQRVAAVRGLDHATIISTAPKFTALPLGHGKHWCFPFTLKCMKLPPREIETEKAA